MGNQTRGTFFALDFTHNLTATSGPQPPQILFRFPDAVRAPFNSGLIDLIGFAIFNQRGSPSAMPQSATFCPAPTGGGFLGGITAPSGGSAALPIRSISGWLRSGATPDIQNFIWPVAASGGVAPDRLQAQVHVAQLHLDLGNMGTVDTDVTASMQLAIALSTSGAPAPTCSGLVSLTPTAPPTVTLSNTTVNVTPDIFASVCNFLGVALGQVDSTVKTLLTQTLSAGLAGGFQISLPDFCPTEFDVKAEPTGSSDSIASEGLPGAFIQIAGAPSGAAIVPPPPPFAGSEGVGITYELPSGQTFTEAFCDRWTVVPGSLTTYNALNLAGAYLEDVKDDSATQYLLPFSNVPGFQGLSLLPVTPNGPAQAAWSFPYDIFEDGGFSDLPDGMHLRLVVAGAGQGISGPVLSGPSCSPRSLNWFQPPPRQLAPTGNPFRHPPI